jgi:hypothetical protein
MSVIGALPAIVLLSGVGFNPLPFAVFMGATVFASLI